MSESAHTMDSETVDSWDKLRSAMLYRQWEVPILVSISVACQVFLGLLSNRRRYSRNPWLNSFLWLAYIGADSVATLALGIISTNLTAIEVFHSTLKTYGPRGQTLPLSPRIQLQTFWAPFFLLHLGGPDTITAYGMEDNELWRRHLLTLVFQTGLTLNILFEVRKQSSLTALSAMMFAAGSIKYAERTWCLWFASYKRGQQKWISMRTRNRLEKEDKAILLLPDTEDRFADALVIRNPLCEQIVQEDSPPEVIRLIEMELEMMYDNLYTKARVILSCPGLTLRFVSFLLTCISLILFSFSGPWTHAIPEYSLTLLLFAVSIGLELYAAFCFLTMYRTISWLRVHNMGGVARFMPNLAKLTAPKKWSNSMGQFNQISYIVQNKSIGRLLMERFFPTRSIMWFHVNYRDVPPELQTFIHEYLKKASSPIGRCEYADEHLPFVKSRGKVPWDKYIDKVRDTIDANALKHASSLFNGEFGQMILSLHFVTEICYYMDRPHFATNVDTEEYKRIFDKSRFSKYLSRYLMHLFVLSSDLLPQETPLSKLHRLSRISEWELFFTLYVRKEREREGEERDEKEKMRALKVGACKWALEKRSDMAIGISLVRNILEVMRPDDVQPPQLERRWEVLSEMWVELLVNASDQSKGRAHAQHLTKGGELLTHVWVLLGHYEFS